MITVQFTPSDATFLAAQLGSQLTHVEHELVRTDSFAMQHELRLDLERLAAIRKKLLRGLEAAEVAA